MSRNFIEALAKGFVLLEVLGRSSDGLTLPELTSSLKMVKSSVFRLLYTLEQLGYVTRSGPHYRLGLKCILLGEFALGQTNLSQIARPYLERIRDEFKETANLAIIDGDAVLYLEVLESPHPLRAVVRPGHRSPLHTSALGKCLIAYFSEEELHRILKTENLQKLTASSISSFQTLTKELARVRQLGYAFDDREDSVGTRCVGAPIFSDAGKPIAAISLSAPAVRLPGDLMKVVSKRMRETSEEISRRLSHSGDSRSAVSVVMRHAASSATG